MLVVAAVSLMLCLRLFSLFVSRYRSKLSFFFCFCFFFLGVFLGFFFFSPSLSLSPILLFSLSLFPFFVGLSHNLFFISFIFPFFFLLSLSCFLCPLVLSVTVWLSKMVYKVNELINIKKKINKKRKKK